MDSEELLRDFPTWPRRLKDYGDVDTQHSTTDFIFILYGGLVSWRSYLQPITALTTMEVEYIRVIEVAKEALWLKGLALEMDLEQKAVKVHCDSQRTILLAQNSIYHTQTKHIDIRCHRIRELMEDGEVDLMKVCIKENLADAPTKVLPQDSFCKCVGLMQFVDKT